MLVKHQKTHTGDLHVHKSSDLPKEKNGEQDVDGVSANAGSDAGFNIITVKLEGEEECEGSDFNYVPL